MCDKHTFVRLRFTPGEDLPRGECMAAEPADPAHGAGAYRLLNCSFFAPLAAGDIVRAEPDGSGDLQVVDVVAPGNRILTVTGYASTVDEAQVRRIADAWTVGTDGWTEGAGGLLFTIWAEGKPLTEIGAVLRESIGGSPDWCWHETLLPGDRTRERQQDIEFALDQTVPDWL